jgi:hypothetical protein
MSDNGQVPFFEYWVIVEIILEYFLQSCAEKAAARLVEATNARQEAENQNNIAQDKKNQALSATSVNSLCSYATQARTAADAADDAANTAEDAALLAQLAANECPGNAGAANSAAQAQQQAVQARAAATNADSAADLAESLCSECSGIPMATISVHVQDDDKYEDDVSNANVTVTNLSHPSCPEMTKGGTTGSNGRCSITGRFMNSNVIVQVNYGSYHMSRSFYMAATSRSEYFKIPGLDV